MRTALSPSRFLVSALVVIAACLGCSQPGGESDAGDGKPVVALIMKSLANEFFSTMAAGAEQHHQEHADEYDLIVNGIKDERDLARQVALVEEMVARGVDAVVIAPADSKALTPALKRAADQGVVVINIDNKLDDAVLADAGIEIPFVGPDNRAGARKVGEHLAGLLSAGDEVAILEGIVEIFDGDARIVERRGKRALDALCAL